MSVAACGGGMDGSGGGDDKKGEPIDKLILPSTSEDDTEGEETAGKSTTGGTKKERGLSKHYIGKSKSYGKLTDLGNTKSAEIVKKEPKINKRRREKIAKKFRNNPPYGPSAGSQSSDQPMAEAAEEGEITSSDEIGEDDKKKKKKKRRKKSQSGASADHPMAEADDKMADD